MWLTLLNRFKITFAPIALSLSWVVSELYYLTKISMGWVSLRWCQTLSNGFPLLYILHERNPKYVVICLLIEKWSYTLPNYIYKISVQFTNKMDKISQIGHSYSLSLSPQCTQFLVFLECLSRFDYSFLTSSLICFKISNSHWRTNEIAFAI